MTTMIILEVYDRLTTDCMEEKELEHVLVLKKASRIMSYNKVHIYQLESTCMGGHGNFV